MYEVFVGVIDWNVFFLWMVKKVYVIYSIGDCCLKIKLNNNWCFIYIIYFCLLFWFWFCVLGIV